MTETMVAGRELDALVAEKVMGMVRCQGPYHDIVDNWPNTYCFASPDNPAHGAEVRQYSTDIADAWKVVERLQEDGWAVDIRIDDEAWDMAKYGVSLFGCNRGRSDNTQLSVPGDTAPLAICRAALKAVGLPDIARRKSA